MRAEWKYTPREYTPIEWDPTPDRTDWWFLHPVSAPVYPSEELICKAISVLNDLFAFLDENKIEIMEDSEQECVAIDIGDGFVITYQNSDKTQAEIIRDASVSGMLTLVPQDQEK